MTTKKIILGFLGFKKERSLVIKVESHDLFDEEDLRLTRTISKLLRCLASSNISVICWDILKVWKEKEGEGEREEGGSLKMGVLAFDWDCF